MRLSLCFPCAEFAPFAKAGGLGDVCAALAAYLHRRGHDIRVVLPYYRSVSESGLAVRPVPALTDRRLHYGPHMVGYSILEAVRGDEDPPLYLVDCPEFYDREALYGDSDHEHLRFATLCDAAIDFCQELGWAPDIMHCHDWHTALVPVLLATRRRGNDTFRNCRSILTLHNLGYQGVFPDAALETLGLGPFREQLEWQDQAQGVFGFLKNGILMADWLSTVSPTYAREITTPEYGFGLDPLLRQRESRLVGILNGVDYDIWDPACDRLLPHPYSVRDLSGKREMKKALLDRIGLAGHTGPLITQITRLTEQKGIDLLMQVLPGAMEHWPLALAVLGTGETRFADFYQHLADAYPQQVRFVNTYNTDLAHWIEAAGDMFVMPSRYEPCGLNQMYSLRYGNVPIVRRTGGLADTVTAADTTAATGTGFLFDDYDAEALADALASALATYREPEHWHALMVRGMREDFSWETQGSVYESFYRQVLSSQ